MKKGVFFDRDGVLNEAIIKNGKPYPPASLEQLKITPSAAELLQKLKKLDFELIGITNQPDVARGTTTKEKVIAINAELMRQLPLMDIKVCFHDDKDQCSCRKPLPGLLYEAAKAYDIDLANSYMVGDRYKDIAAGQAAGCKTIWLDANYDEPKPANPDFIAKNLEEGIECILRELP